MNYLLKHSYNLFCVHLEQLEEVVVLLRHVLQLGLDHLQDERGRHQRARVDQRVVRLVCKQ